MTATAPLVRAATPDDLAAIQAIYAHHVLSGTASFEQTPPDEIEIARRFAAVQALGAPYLVGELDGAVRGFAYAGAYRPRAAYRLTVEDSIYVDPAATGHGLGTALLDELIQRCTQAGFRQMIAVIGGSDNTGSIRLHERLGFTHAGCLAATGLKFGRWVDTVLMQRALGEGDATLPEE